MGETEDLKNSVELYKKLKAESDEQLNKAIDKAAQIRSTQKAQLTRPYKPAP